MRRFFYLSSCNTCKRILNELPMDESISQIDIKKNPITVSQLEVLYKMVGSYEALINKRAQLFKKLSPKDVKLNEQKYKSLLLEHYTFLKRPVLLYDGHIFVGNSSKTISAAKSFLNEQ